MPLGLPELRTIAFLGALIFGARRIPELGQSLGKGIRQFKNALGGEAEPEDERKDQSSSGG